MVGEIERVRASQRGHLWFELVEKGEGDEIVGKLDAVLWRTARERVRRVLRAGGQAISEGQLMRCRGRVDFYPAGGRLQFVVEEIDPLFTLGHLERRRRETLRALEAAGLVERNRQLPLAAVPLRIGLVTSEDSAAFHDFLTGLAESGYGFQVVFAHAAVQGREAEAELIAALTLLGNLELDAIALVRGGGSRTDLAVFDSRALADAVARCPVPVLTGLGHEIDHSIADLVSHTALKTPTKVAELLVERVAQADHALTANEEILTRRAGERLRRAREALRRCERLAPVARLHLRQAASGLEAAADALERLSRRSVRDAYGWLGEFENRVRQSAQRVLERRRQEPESLARGLAAVATGRLRQARAVVDGATRLCHELSPERLLERGFSITRDHTGQLVREPGKVRPGEIITSRLAGGMLKSRVEEI